METESNWTTDLESVLELARIKGKAVLLQFHRDECAGCKKQYASTYPEPDCRF